MTHQFMRADVSSPTTLERTHPEQFKSLWRQNPLPSGWKAEWDSEASRFTFTRPDGHRTFEDPRDSMPEKEGGMEDDVGRMENAQRSEKEGKGNRYCCALFTTRKGCLIVVGSVVFAFCIAISVTLWWAWPRAPVVLLSAPYVPTGILPIQFNSGLTPQLQVNLAVDVSVWSKMNWDCYVSSIDFEGTFYSASNTPVPNVRALGTKKGISFPSKRNTLFTLDIGVVDNLVVGSTLKDSLSRDPFAQLLLAKCVTSSGSLDMTYSVKLTVPIISWTGYRPISTGTLKVPCPGTSATIRKLVGV